MSAFDELAKPKRIQRKRTKGWKMPPNTVYVGRPTEWGNPHTLDEYRGFHVDDNNEAFGLPDSALRQFAVDDYRAEIMHFDAGFFRNHIRAKLRGKNLACWCPLGQPCHADILLEIANEPL